MFRPLISVYEHSALFAEVLTRNRNIRNGDPLFAPVVILALASIACFVVPSLVSVAFFIALPIYTQSNEYSQQCDCRCQQWAVLRHE